MARNKKTKPVQEPVQEADSLGYEAAEPADVSVDDLGLDEILAQIDNERQESARQESARQQPQVTTVPQTGTDVQIVAPPVPLSNRVDLATGNAMHALVGSAINDLDSVGQEIMTNWRADRAETQEVIDHLKDAVLNRTVTNGQGNVPQIYLESLVKAMEVKGNLSLTAVKVMDAKTKLLAALKSGINVFNQQNNVGPSSELEGILAEPVDDDFRPGKK